jgi:hypothetical protein
MRNLLFSFFIMALFSVHLHGQSGSLYKQNENNPYNMRFHIGADVDISVNNYVAFTAYLGTRNNRAIFGITTGLPFNTGMKGSNYSGIIAWNQFPQDGHTDGKYSIPIAFESGIHLHKNFVLGASIGCALKYRYRNKFDNSYILDTGGYYHIITDDGYALEYSAFCHYYIQPTDWLSGRFYLKGQYSATMGATFGVGIEI